MSESTRKKIDIFFGRFSYSAKVRFILFFCFMLPLILAATLYLTFTGILTNLKKQKIGIAGLVEINELMLGISSVQSDDLKKTSAFIESHLDRLENLAKQLEQISSKKLFNNTITEEVVSLKMQWQNAYEAPFSIENFSELFKEIKSVLEEFSYDSLLNAQIDSNTHSLIDSFSEVLLPSQWLLYSLALQGKRDDATKTDLSKSSTLSNITSLEAYRKKLSILLADIEDNSYTSRENMNIPSQEAEAYQSALKTLVNTIKNSLFDESFVLPAEPIQAALAASNNLVHSTAKILDNTIDRQEKFIFRTFITQFIILAIVLMLCILFFFSKIIRNPIHNLKKVMNELASGNLSVRVPIVSNDEIAKIAHAFNDMAAEFESIINEAGQITPHLNNISTNVFKTTKQLETAITDQQIVVERMRENVYSISLSLQEFIDSIVRANRTAASTSKLAGIGMFSLEEMETIMKQMDQGSNSILQTLSELSEKVGRINNVITSIVKIADQSNLLSLNTAIRAGKTGAKGLGVSVIAEKIRELADQIAYATLDIEDVVKEIIEGVSSTLTEVESFSSHIRQQVSEMTEISEKLKKLIRDTQDQIRLFEDINRGMQEQIETTASIHKQIHQFSDNTKNAFESVQTLYQLIEYLNFGTEKLEKLTGPGGHFTGIPSAGAVLPALEPTDIKQLE